MLPPFTMRNRDEVMGSLFIGSIAALILWAVAWTVLYELRIRAWLRDPELKKALVKGTVASVTTIHDDSAVMVDYIFTDPLGKPRKGCQTFSMLALAKKHVFHKGDEITVVCNPDNSSLNYIDGYVQYYQKRETGYILGFIQMLAFMTAFMYTSSLVWPFAALVAVPLLKWALVKLFERRESEL